MPVPEARVRALLVADLIRVQEQPELRLGGDAPALVRRVRREVVVRGQDGPVPRVLHRHGPVQRAHLHRAPVLALVLDPARGHGDDALARPAPERLELPVRDRPPVDAERADLDRARGALVVPPELVLCDVVLELGQEVVRLLVVVAHRDRAGTEGDCWGGRGRGGVPLCGERGPWRRGEPGGREHARAGALDEDVEDRL